MTLSISELFYKPFHEKNYQVQTTQCSLTLSLLAATLSTHVTSADQGRAAKPTHPCSLIMVCIVHMYFENFPKIGKWF
jgi:hypothetical protein